MPEHINLYNATHERCDMMDGPCSCGAWHSEEEILKKLEKLCPAVDLNKDYYGIHIGNSSFYLQRKHGASTPAQSPLDDKEIVIIKLCEHILGVKK